MSIRTILVPLDGSQEAMAALQAAVVIGRKFKSHMDVLHVKPDARTAVPLLGEGMSGAMIEEMITLAEQEGNERSQKAHDQFDEFCKTNKISVFDRETEEPGPAASVTAGWLEVTGREDEQVGRTARLADLIVVSRASDEGEFASGAVLNAALFESGRPVLLAPPKLKGRFGKTIAVAWNGSAESARAVSGALPFLKKAEKVYALTADTENTNQKVSNDLADFCAWHGIKAEPVGFSPAGHSVGEAVLMECEKLSADMLVMGAYTHSRMRQLILGGLTDHVLHNATIPVLMAH